MTIEEWAKDFKSYVNELQMPRDDYKGIMEYIDDAIVLLKEQEAVEPVTDQLRNRRCPKCNTILKGRYCHECGQEIKQE